MQMLYLDIIYGLHIMVDENLFSYSAIPFPTIHHLLITVILQDLVRSIFVLLYMQIMFYDCFLPIF